MNLIYRLCPEGNPNKIRPKNMNKMEVVKFCFDSVIKAFPNSHITFLIDKPNCEIVDMVETCPNPKEIEIFHFDDWHKGNMGTFQRQLDIACDMDKVLLLEDDYYFNEGAEEIIDSALDELEFLTPYDHPGYYTEEEHSYKKDVKISGNHHWQSVISTCLTFASTGKTIQKSRDVMKKYGWADHPMWVELTKVYKLWSPIPSLATHMETPFLASNFQWLK